MWLRASRKQGLRVPWAYVRRALALEYHQTPMQLDEWPAHEVTLAVKLLGLEGAAAEWADRRRAGGR